MDTTTLAMITFRWFRSPTWERWYPVIAAAIVAAVWLCFGISMPDDARYLLGATVTFSSVVTGFVGASLSILIALDAPLMHRVRKTSYIVYLQNYLGWALASGVLLVAISLLGMWTCNSWWYGAVWIGAGAFCIGCLYRVAKIMLRIFTHKDGGPVSGRHD